MPPSRLCIQMQPDGTSIDHSTLDSSLRGVLAAASLQSGLLHLVTTEEFLPTHRELQRLLQRPETRDPATNTEHYRDQKQTTTTTIQLPHDPHRTRLATRQSRTNIERDEQGRFVRATRGTTPQLDSDDLSSDYTESSVQYTPFTSSPATRTLQEIYLSDSRPITPITPPPIYDADPDSTNMSDIANCSFTGKPEDQDPQDFMNRLERIILMKTGLSEAEKVRFFELSLKAKSPAMAWFATLKKADKTSFTAARDAFELRWPVKAITEKTTAEKQVLLDETTLKMSDLGRRVAASVGAEEELSHIVWADKVERLAGDIPDTNNLLVASTRKKLPKPLTKLIGLKPMTWKELADAVRSVTLEEIMEKLEEERDLGRYALPVPNTPSKALGTAFQGISISQPQILPTNQYQQTGTATRSPFSAERPPNERLADVLSKSLPIYPRNTEGIAQYNAQILLWQNTHGQNGRGPNETRPYPLSPGTVPVASGECWKCGQRTHHPGPCSAPPVPLLETKWRSIAQTIRKKAEAAAASPISVNLVTEDSDVVQSYDADELAYLQQLANQGKGEGSSR